ncbi:MAG: UDP-glucose--hexose-1-phosphate uridylyltransferase [Parvularculaceae bacterium]|nr:UDP-glucose--hexose-1-phosphate uridylyltransferase [Parvularculaceae bacterium]
MTFRAHLQPHRRFNPLTGGWVLVSPHRARRPWLGQQEAAEAATHQSYDPACYLCPGNQRAAGFVNPPYTGVFAFDNDYPALLRETPAPMASDPLFRAEPAVGRCRVVCFSPDHSATLPELSLDAVASVVADWQMETAQFSERFAYAQIFENKGAMMGCSNPHPHSQIWATSFVPAEVAAEDARQRAYYVDRGAPLLSDTASREIAAKERVIFETDRFLAIVPYWAAWPFETLLIAKGNVARLTDLDTDGVRDFALALKRLTVRYDNLFQCSFPYSMGIHGAPSGIAAEHWRLHAHFFPPLLRSASIKKFMVGFELLAEAQRDLTPEAAAERLRSAPDLHFRSGKPA